MRLDKFLKVSRLIKRRTVAKEVADQGRIEVNGQVAKSSTKIAIEDEITIHYGNKILTVRVLDIKDTTKRNEAQNLYEVVSEERVETNWDELI
ncbi:RNA-binding S4 domain-containing protein [Atopobacter phocae]|uniref:RNA-binding S4 domain-containing protein n=1 Tax=Atopobacter phocae TaxID=136492 RepID=UPI000470E12F|nr:RNA-binding S4 domain-containing protein [Atopobacter phocae]